MRKLLVKDMETHKAGAIPRAVKYRKAKETGCPQSDQGRRIAKAQILG